MERVILHSDCNCFYASVEMLHHPELAGKPLAVGGDPEQRHGIILTANYIAKRAGVKTGTALWEARQACPGLVIVPPRMDLYLRFSNLTREIYREYSDLVESYGLDECWIDCTQSEACMGNGPDLAAEISARIKRELGITVSIGVSWNKIYAKFGSDYRKPDAITVIDRDNYRDIVWESPVEDLLFVGRATSRKLHRFGILTIGDLAQTDAGGGGIQRNAGQEHREQHDNAERPDDRAGREDGALHAVGERGVAPSQARIRGRCGGDLRQGRGSVRLFEAAQDRYAH